MPQFSADKKLAERQAVEERKKISCPLWGHLEKLTVEYILHNKNNRIQTQ
jgi:hypothetical protein